jgi:uncharacterized protein (UPF0335 family)
MDGDNIGHALRGYADRVVTLHGERKELNQTIAGVYGEAKEAGFNITTLREIVRELQMEPDARASRYQLLNEYRAAVGIDFAGTPLGRAASPEEDGGDGEPVVGRPMTGHAETMAVRPVPFVEQSVHRNRGRPRKADSKPMFDA